MPFVLNSMKISWLVHDVYTYKAYIISRFDTNATNVQKGFLSVNCWTVYHQLLNSEQILENGGIFSVRPWNKVHRCQEIEARLCAGGWGTALQAGIARAWFPIVSVGSFVYLFFPDALWPLGRLSFWKKRVPGVSSAGKGGRCVGMTTLPPSRPNRLEILGASNSWRPKCQYRGCHETKDAYPFINLLQPTGHYMHHQFNIQQLYALSTLYLRVLYLSENKQRLVPLTA